MIAPLRGASEEPRAPRVLVLLGLLAARLYWGALTGPVCQPLPRSAGDDRVHRAIPRRRLFGSARTGRRVEVVPRLADPST